MHVPKGYSRKAIFRDAFLDIHKVMEIGDFASQRRAKHPVYVHRSVDTPRGTLCEGCFSCTGGDVFSYYLLGGTGRPRQA